MRVFLVLMMVLMMIRRVKFKSRTTLKASGQRVVRTTKRSLCIELRESIQGLSTLIDWLKSYWPWRG